MPFDVAADRSGRAVRQPARARRRGDLQAPDRPHRLRQARDRPARRPGADGRRRAAPQRRAGEEGAKSPISSSRSGRDDGCARGALHRAARRRHVRLPLPAVPRDAARAASATTCSTSACARRTPRSRSSCPKGTLFLMGDNRDNSLDSRFPAVPQQGIGLVPQENLVGAGELHVLLDRRRAPNGSSRGPGSPPRAGAASGDGI